MTYEFLQSYWWFLVSLLGALLVFLMFVQGANTLIFCLGKTEEERRLIINSTGRKWEFTFTTLVTFGGAFFASFPLFYSTSFGGAYWLWMIILFSFVIQAVSYEFQNKIGNFLGPKAFQICLIINGIVGPLLLGGAVATFFNGSNFLIDKGNITNSLQPVISRWANASHGLDALLDPWNVVLGLAVLMLARILGMLYIKNNIEHQQIQERCTRQLPWNALLFLLFFLPFLIRLLVKDGFSTSSSGITSFGNFRVSMIIFGIYTVVPRKQVPKPASSARLVKVWVKSRASVAAFMNERMLSYPGVPLRFSAQRVVRR